MSTELKTMVAVRGKVQLTQFCGPAPHTQMIQVTQGGGGLVGPDEPGFIQLTAQEALNLAALLRQWAQGQRMAGRRTVLVAFTLSMPNVGSWNGKWSGAEDCYAVVRTLKRALAESRAGSYRYDFGDGWAAGVDVRVVTAAEARALRKRSRGFCGYDWMIDSILACGKIMTEDQRKAMAEGSLCS